MAAPPQRNGAVIPKPRAGIAVWPTTHPDYSLLGFRATPQTPLQRGAFFLYLGSALGYRLSSDLALANIVMNRSARLGVPTVVGYFLYLGGAHGYRLSSDVVFADRVMNRNARLGVPTVVG